MIIPIHIEVEPIIQSELIAANMDTIADFGNVNVVPMEMKKPFDWMLLLKSIYFSGMAFFLLKFIVNTVFICTFT